jgi:hypothetical protein
MLREYREELLQDLLDIVTKHTDAQTWQEDYHYQHRRGSEACSNNALNSVGSQLNALGIWSGTVAVKAVSCSASLLREQLYIITTTPLSSSHVSCDSLTEAFRHALLNAEFARLSDDGMVEYFGESADYDHAKFHHYAGSYMHSYGFMPHDFGNTRFVSFEGRFLKDKDGKLCDSEYDFGGKKLCDNLDVDEDYGEDYSESEGSCSEPDEEYVVVYDSDYSESEESDWEYEPEYIVEDVRDALIDLEGGQPVAKKRSASDVEEEQTQARKEAKFDTSGAGSSPDSSKVSVEGPDARRIATLVHRPRKVAK